MSNCLEGVCEPKLTRKLELHPEQGKTYNLVSLVGPGLFLGASLVKRGGTNGLTLVTLEIDGRKVVHSDYDGLESDGLTQQNPFGLVLLTAGAKKNLTIGFPSPLRFMTLLTLSVTVSETGVDSFEAQVISGKSP